MNEGTGGDPPFAVQFARMLGARVVATTSSDAKAAKLRELGATHVVNYRTEADWARQARDLAGGGADLIVEVRGADTLDASLRLVRPAGTIALIGVLSGAKASINLPLAVMRQVRLQGVTCGHRENFEAMLRAVEAHGIDPVISHRFAFAEAREAFRCMAGNDHLGKIVIDMAGVGRAAWRRPAHPHEFTAAASPTIAQICFSRCAAKSIVALAAFARTRLALAVSVEFLITSFIIVASPGTGVLFTLAAGLSRGFRASVIAAFGCTLGIVPHMGAAILGLSAVLHTSALAFQTFKYLGVAYLLYMAWSALRERGALKVERQVGARWRPRCRQSPRS